MKYNGLVISDIHVGAMDLIKTQQEFSDIFINHINKMKKLDFVVVTGDFFDHKFYLGDKEAIVAHAMLKELIEACKEKNAVLRFVYGTEFHEANQYDVLSLLKIYDKVDVVKYVSEEELLPGMNVLYLPEEHIFSKSEYYKDYLTNEKKYDYIFGHGVIREVMKEVAIHMENKESNSKRKKVPVFSNAELNYTCKGQTFFGHYHINKEIDGKVFSVGSFNRWKFGEEESKGFYEISCDTEKCKYKAEFIENTMASIYKTISFGYDNKIFNSEVDMDNTLNGIDSMMKRDVYDHVRFMFNVPETIENPEATINYLKERYKFKENIKLEIVHGYIEKKKQLQKEEADSEDEKFKFIFDNSMEIEDKISKFISIIYSKDIPRDRLSKYIFSSLNEIINEVEE